ncbi:MAG: hypothetical protein HZB71_08890 [Betaproteobacteria bacterium]|nr:hypothetical protein [Betaproteobacteria bacterium]
MRGDSNVLLRLLALVGRYIGIAFGCLAAFPVVAETIPASSSSAYYSCNWNTGGSSLGVTRALACATYPGNYLTGTYSATGWEYCTGNKYGSCSPSASYSGTPYFYCPTNQGWTLSGASCTRGDCLTGQTRDGTGQCQDPPECNAVSVSAWVAVGFDANGDRQPQASELYPSSQGIKSTHGVCAANFDSWNTSTDCRNSADGQIYCYLNGVTAGLSSTTATVPDASGGCAFGKVYTTQDGVAVCTDPATVADPTNITSCPPPKSLGTVNGKQVCLASTASPSVPQTTTSASSGVLNPDGSYTSTTTVDHANGSQTVTTDKWDAVKVLDGKPQGAPTSSTEVVKNNAQGDGAPGEKDYFGSLSGSDPAAKSVSLGWLPGTLSEASSCPADKSFTVAGQTYSVSYTQICNAATDYVRPLVILLASVMAYMIFVNGMKS